MLGQAQVDIAGKAVGRSGLIKNMLRQPAVTHMIKK
jgi:hypothetical protein